MAKAEQRLGFVNKYPSGWSYRHRSNLGPKKSLIKDKSLADYGANNPIPQKVSINIITGISEIVPSEVNCLSAVIDRDDESIRLYGTNSANPMKFYERGTFRDHRHHEDGDCFIDPNAQDGKWMCHQDSEPAKSRIPASFRPEAAVEKIFEVLHVATDTK